MSFLDNFKQGAKIGTETFTKHPIRSDKAAKNVYKKTEKQQKRNIKDETKRKK